MMTIETAISAGGSRTPTLFVQEPVKLHGFALADGAVGDVATPLIGVSPQTVMPIYRGGEDVTIPVRAARVCGVPSSPFAGPGFFALQLGPPDTPATQTKQIAVTLIFGP